MRRTSHAFQHLANKRRFVLRKSLIHSRGTRTAVWVILGSGGVVRQDTQQRIPCAREAILFQTVAASTLVLRTRNDEVF